MITWAGAYDDDWVRAWRECPRGDWLLGLAARLGVERPKLVLAATAAARTALEPVPPGAELIERALALAEAWARGHASLEECRARSAELDRFAPPDPVLATAAAAGLCALLSVEDADAAAGAAANAAQAALFGAADCALLPLLGYAQRETAERVREHLPVELILSHLDSQ